MECCVVWVRLHQGWVGISDGAGCWPSRPKRWPGRIGFGLNRADFGGRSEGVGARRRPRRPTGQGRRTGNLNNQTGAPSQKQDRRPKAAQAPPAIQQPPNREQPRDPPRAGGRTDHRRGGQFADALFCAAIACTSTRPCCNWKSVASGFSGSNLGKPSGGLSGICLTMAGRSLRGGSA